MSELHAYAYESGYQDGLRTADTEREALTRRIDELCAENERLRELADGAANEADRLTHDAAALQIENAKLRMLCEWLLNPYRLGAVTGEGIDRQWCRETYDGGTYRLRALGIEVPHA